MLKQSINEPEAIEPQTTKPAFVYDDCCPLCKGYTAVFTGLGWTDRVGFSTLDEATLHQLDIDTARHFIPLHDQTTGATKYGLDGILSVVGTEAPLLRPIISNWAVRRGLDAFYWFVTYNRRHIVTAAPPAGGFDCAPDYNPAAVRAYHAFCATSATTLAVAAGIVGPTVAASAAATALVTQRKPNHGINSAQAAGHVGSVALAAAIVGAATKAATGSPALAGAATAVLAARKLWLRRWMVRP